MGGGSNGAELRPEVVACSLVMRYNFAPLLRHRALLFFRIGLDLCLFDVVFLGLLPVEASGLPVPHVADGQRLSLRDVLHEADHCLVAS